MGLLNEIYDRSPPYLQSLGLNMFAMKILWQRHGRKFNNVLDFLLESQWFSKSQMEEYQSNALRNLVRHAYETVPFYRKVMLERGLSPTDFSETKDLKKLPILTKDIVRQNFDDLLSNSSYGRRISIGRTSGTTGSPLEVAWDTKMQIFNHAVDWRQKYWAGVSVGSRMALLLGRPIVAIERVTPPFWQTNYVHKQLWMSAFHMSPSNLPYYVKKLQEFNPVAIEGYPSTLYTMAQFIHRSGVRVNFKAAFCSSEPLYPFQREEIESAFQCPLFDFYGSAERVVFATECEAHTGQHINFEYGVVELLDERGAEVSVSEVEGEIVATSLQNFGMPLIRYQMKEKTHILGGECSCGRALPRMASVQTKSEDCVIRLDGTIISSSVLTHPFKPIKSIEKSQIIQISGNRIEIKIVRRDNYTTADEEKLLSEFTKRVGPTFNVDILYCKDISSGPNGKFRWVINQCNAGSR